MIIDKFGQQIYTEHDLCDMYLSNSEKDLKNVFVDNIINFSGDLNLEKIPELINYTVENISLQEFDRKSQSYWFMPVQYINLDIAQFILSQCKTDEELQRAGQELLLFQERDMFDLLRYLKYLVDKMRENNIVWGVGRGSSVASFVLYTLGVHKINSLYYDLSIDEFLK